MSFSPGQQAAYRKMTAGAWRVAAGQLGAEIGDKAAYRAWYEEELFTATGRRTTKECNVTKDYDNAMAHFEAILGESYKWQLKQANGDRTRLLHNLRTEAPEFECDDAYMFAIIAQGRSASDHPQHGVAPAWSNVSPEELGNLLISLRRQIRRQAGRGGKTDQPRGREPNPF